VQVLVQTTNDTVELVLNGRFEFRTHAAFRSAYERIPKGPGTRWVVVLTGVDHMDSSALGMLLLLREHAGGNSARVELRGANETVRKILRVACFHQLFLIPENACPS
jgi:HptB-dependent secretion and biofilm anti anti-sigma factor